MVQLTERQAEARRIEEPSAAGACLGLSEAEALNLRKQGKGNTPLKKPTRSVLRIFADNIFNYFNFINCALGFLVVLVCLQDARYLRNLLFMFIVVVNTGVSIYQEWRAKRTVDRLSLITAPHVEACRDGVFRRILLAEIVPGDLLRLRSGQQVVVDGHTEQSEGLELDESLLTGESDAIRKGVGDPLMSGSVVLAGQGLMRVEKVSKDTLAARITLEAQKEKPPTSALMRSLNRLLKLISLLLFPIGLVLLTKIYTTRSGDALLRGVVSVVGLLISMLPEGLVLLTSIALAVSVIQLGRKKALVQTLPSIETLARVDTLCLDKTGTITSGKMRLLALVDLDARRCSAYGPPPEHAPIREFFAEPARGYSLSERAEPELLAALQAQSQSFPEGNATQEALNRFVAALGRPEREAAPAAGPWKRLNYMAFASRRKWSCCSYEGRGSWYLGAAEKLLDEAAMAALRPLSEGLAQLGLRVVLLASTPRLLGEEDLGQDRPLPELRPRALLLIADEIRADVARTFRYFRDQDVALKIISGDHPYTVEAIARRAGVEGFERLIDMSGLPEDADLSEIAESYQLFGRVSPFQKRALLKALQQRGHTVAMTGDGVNDVLALKDADCGVAMASGSDAARAAADIVLLDNRMSLMVDAVYEGRRVINNIQRVASLFLIKTTYSCLFALMMLLLPISFPVLPIQGSLINSVAVGIPSFFLALKPNRERVRGRFFANVAPAAIPPGLSAVTLLLLLQLLKGPLQLSPPVVSTYAMVILIVVSLRALYSACLPFDGLKTALFALCTLLPAVAILFFPGVFMMALPMDSRYLTLAAIILCALLATQLFYRLGRSRLVRGLYARLWKI